MTTAFDAFGYEDLRTYLQNNWNWLAFVDGGGTEQLRWDLNNNNNVSWTNGPSTNPLTAEITVTGQDLVDAGGTLPITLVQTEVFKNSSATTRLGHDTHTEATFEATADEVVFTHDYEMPPIN